ncbi:hypothetical protein BH23ACT10_BH23ACT10_09330 [soil metagenome]
MTTRQLAVRDLRRLTTDTIRRVYEEIIDFRPPAQLRDRAQRILAIAGGQEVAAVRTSLVDILDASPNATAAIAPGLQHGWAGEDPALFAAMVRAWISGTPLPPALEPVAATN